MNEAIATRLTPRRRAPALWSAGGLIVVGGPPLNGKSILAARLADILPFSHKLEVVDNLAARGEFWDPTGLMRRPHRSPLAKMLEAAADIWSRSAPSRVVIIAARAATPASRQLARRAAADAHVKFLHVEALAHSIRAFERLSALMLSRDELLARMQRYEIAMQEYVPVNAAEVKSLPAVRLRHVLSDADRAVQTILENWVL